MQTPAPEPAGPPAVRAIKARALPGSTVTYGMARSNSCPSDINLPGLRAGLCRHYFVINGTLVYTPGFGTNNRDAMFDLYDRTARSFVLEQTPSSPDP